MIGFLGEYEVTVDAKGRFLLPAAIKKKLPEDSPDEFVINRGFEKCLTLYPVKNWEPILEGMNKLNDFDPKVREFRRYFFNGATELELDSAGRLLIPPNLRDHAGINRDIVLVGAIEKIEIWDSKKYKEFFDSMTPQSFSQLAKEVIPNGLNNGIV
jgi:MraZ protein